MINPVKLTAVSWNPVESNELVYPPAHKKGPVSQRSCTNQNPALINRPYCNSKFRTWKCDRCILEKCAESTGTKCYIWRWIGSSEWSQGKWKVKWQTFIKFSIMSLLFTAINTTMHRFKRPAWLWNQEDWLVSGPQFYAETTKYDLDQLNKNKINEI